MLPPVDEIVLQNNPDFANLYKTVTGTLLNTDGSTKNDPVAKQRDHVRLELKAHRFESTKQHLLCRAIATAIPDPTAAPAKEQKQQQQQHRRAKSRAQPSSQQTPPLPSELMDLLLLIPPFLTKASTMTGESLRLLLTNSPFTDLSDHFPQLIELISSRLHRQASTLARVLNPNTNPSYIHRSIPSLPTTTVTLLSNLETSKLALSAARLHATASLTRHLQQHTTALTLLLRTLEAKHGPGARSTELRAEEANLEAQTWAVAVEALLWETRKAVYPPQARAALANYRRHLRDAEMRLWDGARVREAELRDYGVVVEKEDSSGGPGVRKNRGDEGKERTMREMGRVWREMETRLREVKGDLDRLR